MEFSYSILCYTMHRCNLRSLSFSHFSSSASLCRKHVPLQILPTRGYRAKYDRTVQWELRDDIVKNEKQKIYKHGGMVRIGAPDLPLDLNLSINRILMKFNPKTIRQDIKPFLEHYRNRVPAPDPKKITRRARAMEREYLEGKNVKLKRSMSEYQKLELESKLKDVVLPKLRNEFYNWKPIEYTPYLAALFLVTRFTQEYTIASKVLTDLKQRVPDFAPDALFDFGSGVGTVAHAVNAVFGSSVTEYFCVDASPDMNEVAREIVANGGEDEKPLLQKAYFRQFLPGLHDRKFDLVMSSFTLMDVGPLEERLEAVRNLWQKTKRFLILIEDGSSLGYRTIMEARDHVLGLDRDKRVQRKPQLAEAMKGGTVFAPCPHNMKCPRLIDTDNEKVVCHFPVSFAPLPFITERHMPNRTGTFSYVVLEKNQEEARPDDSWPRVVEPTLKKHHRAVCRLCCPDGKLKELMARKKLDSTSFYSAIRSSKWGDRVPVAYSESATEVTADQVETQLSEDDNEVNGASQDDDCNDDDSNKGR